uniref:AIG1-type G domain-containing protein n=1 Tax=Astyanax mexicanus TaxID=7994 RepID=A0A8B9JJ85_ASTMX
MLETMVIENEWSYLQWEEYEAPTASQQYEQTTAQKESEKTEKCQKTPSVNNEEKSMKSWSERLNLVVCGSEGSVKSSISDLILGEREFSAESRSVCVKREAEVCGRLISLVELPALYSSQLSEEEVMRETLRCVSLCDPGVHAFLLVLPEGRLTDEDKGELEKIQMIFGTKFRKHTIVLITQSSQKKTLDQDSESLVKPTTNISFNQLQHRSRRGDSECQKSTERKQRKSVHSSHVCSCTDRSTSQIQERK